MKNWEDIVKDKLEGYESPLPEGSLAEFRARRDAAEAPKKRFPIVWLAVPAVAAGLAALLFLRQPGTPDSGIMDMRQPVVAVAGAEPESELEAETAPSGPVSILAPVQTRRPVAQAVTPAKQQTAVDIQQEQNSEPAKEKTMTPEEQARQNEHGSNAVMTTSSPYIPEVAASQSFNIKVGPAAGIVAGGGLLAAVLTPLLTSSPLKETGDVYNAGQKGQSSSPVGDPVSSLPSGLGQDDPNNHNTGTNGQTEQIPSNNTQYIHGISETRHSIPLKVGLMTRLPLSSRLNVSTGLEYSRYASEFNPGTSVEKKQIAHYVGIPVRLDWTLASNRLLEVYVGAGIGGDYCVGATMNHSKVEDKDGLSFSLLGAGGVQLNFNKHLGLYVEPQLSWAIPSENRVLYTYRSEHPLTFAVAAGFRFNI